VSGDWSPSNGPTACEGHSGRTAGRKKGVTPIDGRTRNVSDAVVLLTLTENRGTRGQRVEKTEHEGVREKKGGGFGSRLENINVLLTEQTG